MSTCPRCGGTLKLEPDTPVGPCFHCDTCDYGFKVAGMPVGGPVVTAQPAEPPKGRSGRRSLTERAADVRESDIVEQIRKAHIACGNKVLRIGQRKAKGSGTDEGAPDLLIRSPDWPAALWQAQEAKVPGGAFSGPEQEELAEAGHTVVVHSVEESIVAFGKAEKAIIEEWGC